MRDDWEVYGEIEGKGTWEYGKGGETHPENVALRLVLEKIDANKNNVVGEASGVAVDLVAV